MNKTLFTHRGMWALWDYNNFKHIESIEDFENTFRNEEDVINQVKSNKFVPIYVYSNGEFQFKVKVNEKLDKREKKYITASSKPYLFETDGKAYVSGIELIDSLIFDNEVIELNLEKGSYEVVVNLVEWDREPGMRLNDGSAHKDALPDFIIELNYVSNKKKKYYTDINTFGKSKLSK